ncbi:MAG TPA: ATP-dependent DNA ligase [Gemmatimonadaceae bacterium]|nr:ATP-dependent DNA ligase [Gemmatimonadaceae bacterium]
MLPLDTSFAPMEAESVGEIPNGAEWQYEPKWDGFRCLAFRDGAQIELMSKAGKPLARYFPDIVAAISRITAQRFVLDGEIVVPIGDALSFDDLLQRIHPAKSRVEKLAAETPATLIVFDLLINAAGKSLVKETLEQRRSALEAFAREYVPHDASVRLTPATTNLRDVEGWLRSLGSGLDGIIAKRVDLPYQSGNRHGMRKIKQMRTADCVVGGFRYGSKQQVVGSLLLGLYDGDELHHVGFTSNIPQSEKAGLTKRLERLIEPPGFTGRAPGGPSRWSTERSAEWNPLKPELVVEVAYDHFSQGRFRHGTSFHRWRPDKAPRQCTMAQVEREARSPLALLGRS